MDALSSEIVREMLAFVRDLFGKKGCLFGKASGNLRKKGVFVRESFGKEHRNSELFPKLGIP